MPTYYDSSLEHSKVKAKMYDQRGRWRCVCRVQGGVFWSVFFFGFLEDDSLWGDS